MNGFPWGEAMQLGFGRLRLSSRQFWSMTPRELAAAAGAFAIQQPSAPDRKRLDDMLMKFPDGTIAK